MQRALMQAKDAAILGEVPVGAVIVHNEEIIASAHNQTRTQKDPSAHAEMIAISQAARHIGDWRLNECTLYVTKEPCPMCAGATIISRIKEIHFALLDPKMGGLGGATSLHELPQSNHKPNVFAGTMEEECRTLFQAYFQLKRKSSS